MSGEILNLTVNGMSCSHCENSVKKAVGELKGVKDVKVDLKTKKVVVEYDPQKADFETIRDAIEDQGYDVEQ
ncbi:MAG TPA: copper chaperone CopZ [Desulfitobacteriaceae bacterium]|jgi:copper chaperone|nr:copper chaperone CopZ [Desulfitobacteriaceae bacterium]